jgi:hypothetical protein
VKTANKKISELSHDPHNARRHPISNISAIAASLNEFGQQKPIVITSDNVIIAGNGTYDAAVSLGWTEIAVTVIPADWDSQKVKAFALADNRTAELAQWDARELLDQLESLDNFEIDMSLFGFEPLSKETDGEGEEGGDREYETGTKGLGTPIISFEIVFDNADQQTKWFEFMRLTRVLHPDAETNAERITAALTDFINGVDS